MPCATPIARAAAMDSAERMVQRRPPIHHPASNRTTARPWIRKRMRTCLRTSPVSSGLSAGCRAPTCSSAATSRRAAGANTAISEPCA